MYHLRKVLKYQIKDNLRSKWLLIYTLFFFILSWGITSFTEDSSKIALTLMNIVLLVIPLISIIFGVVSIYNNKDYIVFMLSQPISRISIYFGLFLGISFPLSFCFLLGAGIPVLLKYNSSFDGVVLFQIFTAGFLLSFIFTGIAFYISILNENKMKGLGISLFIWLLFTFLYDAFVLYILQSFVDYPLENISILMSVLNPIDLSRLMIILKLDISALMGYTGAVFKEFFGSFLGLAISFIALVFWSVLPAFLGMRVFLRKDF